MENMCGIKMFSAQDICKGLHVTKETAYAIMKMKESGARYVGISGEEIDQDLNSVGVADSVMKRSGSGGNDKSQQGTHHKNCPGKGSRLNEIQELFFVAGVVFHT